MWGFLAWWGQCWKGLLKIWVMNMQCACFFEPINRKVETPLWCVRSSCKTVFYQKITINCQQNINRNDIYPQIIARKCNMMRIFHQTLQDLLMPSTNLLLFLIFLQYIVGCYIICLLFPLSSNHLSTICFILTEFASSLFKERQTERYNRC